MPSKHKKCPHSRERRRCSICSPQAMCPHGRMRTDQCSVCQPARVYRAYKKDVVRYARRQEDMRRFISLSRFTELVQQACHYCGQQPAMGVDAFDPIFGHTTENCVPCCKTDNFMKRRMTGSEYQQQCHRVTKNMIQHKRRISESLVLRRNLPKTQIWSPAPLRNLN